MKKIIKISVVSAFLLLTSFSISQFGKLDVVEKANDYNNDTVALSVKQLNIGESENIDLSKTYVQLGHTANGLFLRFATAISGPVNKITYVRTAEGLGTVEKQVTTVYKGIKAGDSVYYYDGNDLTTTQSSDTDNYYWAVYTIKFETESYKDTAITAYINVEGKDQSTTSSLPRTSSLNEQIDNSEMLYIYNVEELKKFRDEVNSGNTYEGKTISLMEDIDLSGEAWTPIGNGVRSGKTYTGNAFKGTFDGTGKTINGLNSAETNSSSTVGLFGVIDGATIKNINFDNVSINTASKNVGSAVGLMVQNSLVENIIVNTGNIIGADGVGGIVGRMTVSGKINQCANHVNVEATASGAGVGGIVGKAYYTETDKIMTISNCSNTGEIKSLYASGGIVGLSAADIINCSNTGDISSSTEAGGIAAEQVNRGIVSNNTNNGDVVGEATAAGGIIGWIRYQTSTTDYQFSEVVQVTNNENTGAISKGEGAGSLGYGGIVGTIYNQALVENNSNYAPSITGGTFAAGIVGGAQLASNNLKIENSTITTINNVTSTTLDNIVGLCVAIDVYNNDSSFVSYGNVTK